MATGRLVRNRPTSPCERERREDADRLSITRFFWNMTASMPPNRTWTWCPVRARNATAKLKGTRCKQMVSFNLFLKEVEPTTTIQWS